MGIRTKLNQRLIYDTFFDDGYQEPCTKVPTKFRLAKLLGIAHLVDSGPSWAHVAARSENPAFMQEVADHKLPLNTSPGNTIRPLNAPIHWVRNDDVLEVLLANGADPNLVDDRGYQPIHRAESPEALDILEKYGADLTALTKHGYSLINCLAVENGSKTPEAIKKAVLEKGLDPNYAPSGALPATHAALDRGCMRNLKALAEVGADFSVKAPDGLTLLDRLETGPTDFYLAGNSAYEAEQFIKDTQAAQEIIKKRTKGPNVPEKSAAPEPQPEIER